LGVLTVVGGAALHYPLYRPGASFFPAVAPVSVLLALVVGVARRDRVQLSIALLQACLAFPAILLLGASAAYVANGALDRGPATVFRTRSKRSGTAGTVQWRCSSRRARLPGRPGWESTRTGLVGQRSHAGRQCSCGSDRARSDILGSRDTRRPRT